jgi:hypothetical protein
VDGLKVVTERRQGDGFSAREMLRDDREWVACWACRRKHPLRPGNADGDYADFLVRHPHERGCVILRLGPAAMERAARRAERKRKLLRASVADFLHNASVLQAYGTVTALDLTAIGIASSNTAGWCSNYIDNHTSLYLDFAFYYYSQAVNTAASGLKAHYLYAPGAFNVTDPLPSNTAGNAATNSATTSALLTYLDISANAVGFPEVAVVPYITQNKPLQQSLFGVAQGHNGNCPNYVWLGLVNAAGPTIGTGGSPATLIKYAGSYNTVA